MKIFLVVPVAALLLTSGSLSAQEQSPQAPVTVNPAPQQPAVTQPAQQAQPVAQPAQPTYEQLQEQVKKLQDQVKEKDSKKEQAPATVTPPPPVQKSEELEKAEAKAKGTITPDEAGVGNDRIMTVQTAETLKEGKNSISDYELGILQYSYGITDKLQFSLMFTVPVLQTMIVPSLKYRFLDTEILKMSITAFAAFGVVYTVSDFVAGGGGATVSMDVCLDGGKCASIFTVEGQVFGGGASSYGHNSDSASTLTFNTAAGVQGRVADKVKLLLELSFSGARPSGSSGGGMFTVNYGIRIHGTEFAADIGFMRPVFTVGFSNNDVYVFDNAVMKYLPMGFPYLAFTYQW